jgi:anti-sigma-K factor RskA
MPRIMNPRWHDALASEYVLGTLHGRARARFRQLLRDDPALQARVAFWERELMPMASPLSVAAPSDKVWQGIAARVAPRDRAKEAPQSWWTRWFSTPALGSLAAGLFLGVSAALVGPTLLGGGAADVSETQLPESYVGVLARADGRTGMIVSSRRHGTVMDLKRVLPVPVDAGQTLFLWVIEADGTTRPIGPVPQGSFVQVPLPQTSEKLFASAVELALSVEPAAAAPVLPSGPFVYRGLCGKLWRVKTPS